MWADAVADLADPADRDLRREAAVGLAEAAVAAARWRGGSVPFPGLPERRPGPRQPMARQLGDLAGAATGPARR